MYVVGLDWIQGFLSLGGGTEEDDWGNYIHRMQLQNPKGTPFFHNIRSILIGFSSSVVTILAVLFYRQFFLSPHL